MIQRESLHHTLIQNPIFSRLNLLKPKGVELFCHYQRVFNIYVSTPWNMTDVVHIIWCRKLSQEPLKPTRLGLKA